jgi:poly(3-hydroxybutyrate) depolymerase
MLIEQLATFQLGERQDTQAASEDLAGLVAAGCRLSTQANGRFDLHEGGYRGGYVQSVGKSTKNISANDLMWEFFKRHPTK